MIRALSRAIRRGISGEAVDAELAAHGRALFDEGLPAPVKAALRMGPASLTVLDEVLGVHWPCLHDGQGFLGRSMALGEQVSGAPPLASRATDTDRLLVVADPSGDLPAARFEGEALVRALARAPGAGVDLRPGRLSVADFLRLFGGARLVHFAGHADAPSQEVGGHRGGWRLADGHLDAALLARQAGGAAPGLVFANACRSAGQGESSLAPALLAAGVRHVVSAAVDVADLPGAELAVRFHLALRAGVGVGEALRRARVETPEPVWAAHRLHGDPDATYFKVETGAAAQAGVRRAVALALRIPPPESASTEAWAERRGQTVAAVGALVSGRGGRLLPGQGATLRAVFGLPVGYENDGERAAEVALAAAARWPDAVLALDAGPLMGVGTEAGTDVAGAALSAAEAAAWQLPAGVFALPGARARLRDHAIFGADEGMAVRILGLGTGLAASPLVGREAELARLKAAVLGAVARGRGEAITLSAPAGMGKTRLVEALAAALPEQVRVLRGTARAYDASAPFAAMAEVLRGLLGVPGSADSATVSAALDACIEGLEVGLAPMADDEVWSIDALVARPTAGALWSRRPALLRALGVGAADAEAPPGAVSAAVAHLLATAAGARPIAVIFEDVHWLPPAGRAVVEAVSEAVGEAPLVVIGTARPALGAAPAAGPDRLRVELGPLDDGAASALLDAALPVPVTPEVRAGLLARAEGNPLFIRELAREMAEAGTPLDAVPATVEAVVRARVDRLPPAAQTVLGAAAVLGRTFWISGLRALQPEVALEPALDALARLGFVSPAGGGELGEPGSWRFVHSLVRDVVYQGLTGAERRASHARAALWLADEVAGAGAVRWARVAEHREAAGDPARAAADWVAAATALATGDTPEELKAALVSALLADAAAGGALPGAVRARAQTELAEARRTGGELAEAAALLDAAIAIGPPGLAAVERMRRRAELDEARGELSAARAQLLKASEALEALTGASIEDLAKGDAFDGQPAAVAEVPALHGPVEARGLAVDLTRDAAWLDHRDGQYSAVVARLAPVLPRLPRSAAVQVASVANVLGLAHYAQGDDAQAETCFRRSLSAAEASGRADRLRAACNNLGLLAIRRGDHAGAAGWFRQVVQIYARLGDRDGLAIAYNNLGALAGEQGDYARAARYLEESIRIRERAGHAGLALGYANLGEAILLQGDPERAGAYLDRAIALCEAGKGPGYLLPDVLRMRAEQAVAQGDPPAAVGLAERALALARASNDAPRAAVAQRALAEAQFALGRVELARQTISEAVAALDQIDAPHARTRALAAQQRLTDLSETKAESAESVPPATSAEPG